MQLIVKQLHTELTTEATLTAYLADNSPEIEPTRVRPAVLICPGGGYEFVSDREAEPVALRLLAAGYQALVLRYSVGQTHPYPAALLELATAMQLTRQNAAVWHINPNQIVVAGFSAGGHLAGSLGTNWDGALLKQYGFKAAKVKPNALMLAYPVITAGKFAHRASFLNLLGPNPTDAALAEVSLEHQVTPTTPPTFLWATVTDDTVPVENTLLFANALQTHHVSFELHLFPSGGHGLSLATHETYSQRNAYGIEPVVAQWVALFTKWVDTQFDRGPFVA